MDSSFSHYFSDNQELEHKPISFTVMEGKRALTFETDAGVFSRGNMDKGSCVLLDALKAYTLSGRLLDLGCGWGGIGITLLARHPELCVVFCDVNSRAVELTRANLLCNGMKADTYVSDGFSQVPGSFDWIILNPPIRAGKEVVYRIIDEARGRLVNTGTLAIVWRKQQGAESAIRRLSEKFHNIERVSRDAGYWVITASSTIPL